MSTIKFKIILSIIFFISLNASAQVLIDWNDQWSYFKGRTEPSQPNYLWIGMGFNDSSWSVGNAPFRYGDGNGGTLLSDMAGNYSTFYIRKEINIINADTIGELIFSIDYDDGFLLWINEELIIKTNAPSNYAYNQFAPANHESGDVVSYTIKEEDVNLLNGVNTVAIQGFNVSSTSSDFYLDIKLEAFEKLPVMPDLPETDGVTCDIPSGFYNDVFSVNISSSTPGDIVKYTLDGSDPRYSLTSVTESSPVSVMIDPESTSAGRGKTGGVVLRASKFEEGFAPSRPISNTYIFVNSVINQDHPGGSWPTNNVNGQIIDLLMDSRVTTDNRYKYDIEDAMLDLPSISITTDPDNLFGSQNGIYVNAQFHGKDWERPANIELINPDGSPGFNIDAGIRIRGGWSRHDGYPKHAFRLFFRSEYGESKLKFPLFENEGTDKFDKIDIRSTQNYSWANGGDNGKHNTMNRDVFSRDTQRDMFQPYTRSRYYHLYLNGLYWGVFQTQERGEAAFADSYFGGSKADYDVIKVDIGENWNVYEIEATDGNTDAWRSIWEMCQKGFSSNADYFKLLGLTSTGEIDTSLNVWVDVDNLIDYMLIIFYGGNFDSPVSKFSNNYNPNNFFAIYNRAKKREGFKFLAHDAEHTLLTDPVGPGDGLYENRVNIGNTSNRKMDVSYFGKFHPQWLHFKLSENEEYRVRFADRVYRHFFNNGVLTVDSCISRFKQTSDQLDLAIIAESARWGDRGFWQPRTKDNDWIPAVNRVINDFMPYRSDIVLNQLIDEDLFNSQLKPPVYRNTGTNIMVNKITISENYNLSIENINNVGSIVYTIDGNDPRAAGGVQYSLAINAGKSINISVSPGTYIKARIKYMDSWSPLHEIYFEDSDIFSKLKVTELHYNPLDQGDINGKDLEFIELKNTGSNILDLTGFTFTDGILFTFPAGSNIPPGSFIILASDKTVFADFYGFSADFEFSGNLSNGGEKVTLKTNTNKIVFDFSYSDDSPWPVEADGDGYSLVSVDINPQGDPNTFDYWTISKYENGSPLDNDLMSVTGITNFDVKNLDFQFYPNPVNSDLYINFSVYNEEKINVSLYDLNGRFLQTLFYEYLPAGNHNKLIHLNSLNIKSGMYLIVFKTNDNFITKKMFYNK